MPNPDELFLLGTAPTFPIFAIGNPSLDTEKTTGISPTIGVDTKYFNSEISTYANLSRNFIYFSPDISTSGNPAYEVTIRGAFPRFTFEAIDALFYGLDGWTELFPDEILGARLSLAMVRAIDENGDHLLGIPADQVTSSVQVRPSFGWVEDPEIEISGEFVDKQNLVDPSLEFAPPPEAYWLLNASLSGEFEMWNQIFRVNLSGRNLLNAKYRSYTSLMRYYADSPGRDVRLNLVMDLY